MMPWIVGALALAVGIYLKWRFDGRRREALFALATQGGWDFSPAHDEGVGRLCDFDAFSRGEDRYALNTITGSVTCGALLCALDMGDFSYAIKTDDGKSRYTFSYLVLKLPFRRTPSLKVRRENILDRVAQAAGFEDIDFESEEFSRTFCVTSSDKRFAYDLLHPRMMEYFLDIAPPALIELAEGRLCVTEGRRRWNAEEFRKTLSWAKRFASLWPEHLAEDLGHHR